MRLQIRASRAIRCAAMSALLCASASTYALAAGKSEPAGLKPGVSCESLTGLQLVNGKVTAAQAIATGTYQPEGASSPIEKLPPFCRVHVVVQPAVNIEVWLPLAGWNGKLLAVEPGGLIGSISYGNTVDLNELTNPGGVSGLANGIQRGYAMMSSDAGHNTTDNSWYGQLDRVIDVADRGIHEMTMKGKIVTAAFYTQQPSRTYFDACSGGGRVAMIEAQRFPDDYDGIIAGYPGANWNNLMAAELWQTRASTGSAAANFPLTKAPMVTAAAIAKCDEDDGLKDGLISTPATCHFDPGVLQCKGADQPDCLTPAQVDVVRKMYAGPHYPDGRRISYGLLPGSESGWGTKYIGITDVNTQGGVGDRLFIKLTIFNDPNYDLKSFDFNRDMDFMNDKAAAIMNATNPDLSGFKARGGKLLTYYGWADDLAPPQFTPDYYESVVAKLGSRTAVESFYRLFMVPGMGHCQGGIGPNKFDMVKVLENWSEKGIAPDSIIASKVDEKTKKVTRTRPLCPWPQVAKYNGVGSIDEAKNFYCVRPN